MSGRRVSAINRRPLVGGDDESDDGEQDREDGQSRLLAGIVKPAELPWPAHAEEGEQQHHVHDRSDQRR